MKRRMYVSPARQRMWLARLISELTAQPESEVRAIIRHVELGQLEELECLFPLTSAVEEAFRIGAESLSQPWKTFIQAYRRFLILELGEERGTACDLCGGLGVDLHEAFVTRAQVRGWRQFYIHCLENCVFLCRKDHESPDRERLLELQRARGYDLDDQGRWPKIRKVLKSDG